MCTVYKAISSLITLEPLVLEQPSNGHCRTSFCINRTVKIRCEKIKYNRNPFNTPSLIDAVAKNPISNFKRHKAKKRKKFEINPFENEE